MLRHRPAVDTVCRFDPAGGESLPPAIVWNISGSGVCILAPEAHPIGAVLTGSLESTDGDHARPVVMRVVHCRKLAGGDYALGARFEQPLSEDELKPFVEG
jgi:PilZ domain